MNQPGNAEPVIPDLRVSDEHFAEQFPLSPLDDYMIHQTPDPIRVMWTGDPRTYERYWMLCHDPSGGSGKVNKPSRRLRFEPETNIFVEGIVDYPLDTGEVKQVHYERIGNQTAYLRCGMYGGTPDREIHQGGYEGPDLVEGETYDVNQPEVRARLAGLDEHLCKVTCDGEVATGFYQPIDPVAYEACAAGRPGWSFLETPSQ